MNVRKCDRILDKREKKLRDEYQNEKRFKVLDEQKIHDFRAFLQSYTN